MNRLLFLCAVGVLAVLIVVVPVSAIPVLTGSGISQSASASWDSSIGPKNSWTQSEGDQYLMGWIAITPGSELVNGVERYQYKYDIAGAGAPQSGLLYGPFPFYQGAAKMSRQVSTLFLQNGPGAYEVRFYITDKQGGSDSLVASMPFTLVGAPTTATTVVTTNAPTTATTVPTTSITTVTTVPTTTQTTISTTVPTTTISATTIPTTTQTTTTTTTPVPMGSLSIATDPAGGFIAVDGDERGISPITVNSIPIGTHTVFARLKGYTDNTTTVTVNPNQMTEIILILSPVSTLATTTTTITTVPVTVGTQKAAAYVTQTISYGSIRVKCPGCITLVDKNTNRQVGWVDYGLTYSGYYQDQRRITRDEDVIFTNVPPSNYVVRIHPEMYYENSADVNVSPMKESVVQFDKSSFHQAAGFEAVFAMLGLIGVIGIWHFKR